MAAFFSGSFRHLLHTAFLMGGCVMALYWLLQSQVDVLYRVPFPPVRGYGSIQRFGRTGRWVSVFLDFLPGGRTARYSVKNSSGTSC